MGTVDDLEALAALRADYDEFYEITGRGRRWRAEPRDGTLALDADSASALRTLLREDYALKAAAALRRTGNPRP
jgi:hypothetical protein